MVSVLSIRIGSGKYFLFVIANSIKSSPYTQYFNGPYNCWIDSCAYLSLAVFIIISLSVSNVPWRIYIFICMYVMQYACAIVFNGQINIVRWYSDNRFGIQQQI